MPLPVAYPNKVTKQDFIDHSVEINSKVSAVSPLTLIAGAAVDKPLIIRGHASQSANLQEWQNSAGTVLSKVWSDGSLHLGAGVNEGKFAVVTNGAASKAIIVRGAASQTANLQEWQDSAGTVLASVLNTGRVAANKGISITENNSSLTGLANGFAHNSLIFNQHLDGGGFGHGIISIGYRGLGRTIQLGTQADSNFATSVFDPVVIISDTHKTIFKGMPSQTANLAEFQNSSGSVRFHINSDGRLGLSGGANVAAGEALSSLYGMLYVDFGSGVTKKIPLYN